MMTSLGTGRHSLLQAQQCLYHQVPMAGTVHDACLALFGINNKKKLS